MAAPGSEDVPALLAALRSNNRAAQVQAARSLSLIAAEPGGSAVVSALMGAIPMLVQRLGSPSPAVQGAAADCLGTMCMRPDFQAAVAAAGPAPALVQLLVTSDSEDMQSEAAYALAMLARNNPANKEALVAAGAVPALLQRLSGSSDELVLTHTCLALRNLSSSSAAVVAIAPGIPHLVRHLRDHSSPHVHKEAAYVLANLASSGFPDAELDEAAATLVSRLASCRGEAQEAVAVAVRNLAHDGTDSAAALAKCGAIPCLVRCLNSSSDVLQKHAIAALGNLSGSCMPLKPVMLESGALAGVCERLHSNSAAVQAMAAQALEFMATYSPTNAAAIMAAGGTATLQQLASGGSAGVRQAAAETLVQIRLLAEMAPPGMDPLLAAILFTRVHATQHAAEQQQAADQHQAAQQERVAEQQDAPEQVQAPAQQEQEEEQQHPARVCAAAGCNSTQHLRRCSACRTVRYCSDACIAAHWKAHKPECKRLKAAPAAAAAAAAVAEDT